MIKPCGVMEALTLGFVLQQSEMQLTKQSRRMSGGRGSGLLPLADGNTDMNNADIRTVQ